MKTLFLTMLFCTLLFSNNEIKSWTIAIASKKEVKVIDNFVKRFIKNSTHKIYIFKVSNLYFATYGKFQTKKEAKEFFSHLSQEFKDEGIYVKRLKHNLSKAKKIKNLVSIIDTKVNIKKLDNGQKKNLFKLNNVVRTVVKHNANLMYKRIAVGITDAKINNAKGKFETHFFIEGGKEHEYIQNNVRDAIVRNNSDIYREDLENIDMGIRGTNTYGTEWSLSLKSQRKSSSLIDESSDKKYEYESGLYIEIKQPLLKGFGKDIGETNINISKLKSEEAQEVYKKTAMELVGNTIFSYWRLYSAIEIHQTWKEIIDLTKEQEVTIKNRVDAGNMSKVSLLEIQNGIVSSEVEMLNALDIIKKEESNLLSLLNMSVINNKQILKPSDKPEVDMIEVPSLEDSVSLASNNWIEFNILDKKIKQEAFIHKYAENQLKPDLQFVGRINSTTLDDSMNDSVNRISDNEFNSWYVGLNFSIPLEGNMKANSEVKQSLLKMNQLSVEKRMLHTNLVNSLNVKINNLKINKSKMRELLLSLKFRNKMIDIYTNQLKYGKINVRDLTDAYRDRVLAKRKLLKGLIDVKISQATLDMATGTLLTKYNINLENKE